jgi:hypothetical protein
MPKLDKFRYKFEGPRGESVTVDWNDETGILTLIVPDGGPANPDRWRALPAIVETLRDHLVGICK